MKRRLRVLIPIMLVVIGAMVWKFRTASGASPRQITASGTVEATEAQLGFQATGRIEALTVEEGDAVRRGMELAWLDRGEAVARRGPPSARAPDR